MLRTVSEKLRFGIAAVLLLTLLPLAAFGWSLYSIRKIVWDVDFALTHTPQRGDLVTKVGALLRPLDPLLTNENLNNLLNQKQEMSDLITSAEDAVLEFHRRLERLPQTMTVFSQRAFSDGALLQIGQELINYRRALARLEGDFDREATVRDLQKAAIHAQVLANAVPDPGSELSTRLQEARRLFRYSIYLVIGTTVISIGIFVWFSWYIFRYLLHPVRSLHEGARLALNDYSYRIPITSNDELGDCALAFNDLTSKYSEVITDLDNQVKVRSDQLVRSERLASVGVLAAGVAHEINNPLSAIRTASEAVEMRISEELSRLNPQNAEVIQTYMKMIQREALRCGEITRRLLDFARGQDHSRSACDLRALIVEVLAMVHHLSQYRGKEIVFEQSEPCVIEANPGEIKQVILNMISNGLDAMDTGGRMKIDFVVKPREVQIRFQDNGCGIRPEDMEELFVPFFTRSRRENGTGLGLSISHRIVRDHRGSIEARSEGLGMGSTFIVHLPKNEPQVIGSAMVAASGTAAS